MNTPRSNIAEYIVNTNPNPRNYSKSPNEQNWAETTRNAKIWRNFLKRATNQIPFKYRHKLHKGTQNKPKTIGLAETSSEPRLNRTPKWAGWATLIQTHPF